MADEQNWTVPVLAGLVVLGLAAAHGIDKTQWSQRFRPAATATGTPTPASTGAGPPTQVSSKGSVSKGSVSKGSVSRGSATTGSSAGPAPQNAAAVTVRGAPTPGRSAASADAPLGIQPGAPAGTVAPTVSTVIVQTSVDTCWTMVVDGSALKGCGPAAVTDTRGAPAAAVTRTSGATGLRVEIVRNSRSAATGTVTSTGRTLVLTTR